jgi:Zn-dependent protease with chaperone function
MSTNDPCDTGELQDPAEIAVTGELCQQRCSSIVDRKTLSQMLLFVCTMSLFTGAAQAILTLTVSFTVDGRAYALAAVIALYLYIQYELLRFFYRDPQSNGMYRVVWLCYLAIWAGYGGQILQIFPQSGYRLADNALFLFALLSGRALLHLPYHLYADMQMFESEFSFVRWLQGRGVSVLVRLIIDSCLFLSVLAMIDAQLPGWWAVYPIGLLYPACLLLTVLEAGWLQILRGEAIAAELPENLQRLATKSGVGRVNFFWLHRNYSASGLCMSVGRSRAVGLSEDVRQNGSRDEVEWIFAHELGHCKAHDVLKGTLVYCLLIGSGVYLYHLYISGGTGSYWDILSETSNFPSLLLSAEAAALILQPLARLHIRYQEGRADFYGLELTETNVGLLERARVYHDDGVQPDWRVKVRHLLEPLTRTHPTPRERQLMARRWQAKRSVCQT